MAERALPDLRARLLLDTGDLAKAPARAREVSRELQSSLKPAEDSLARVNQHFSAMPAAISLAGSGVSRFGSVLGGATTALRTVGVVAGTALAGIGTAAVGFVGHATMVALRASEMGIALQALARANNVSVDALNANVTAIRHQGIEIGVAQNLVAEFVQGHLDLAKAQNLARVAQDAAVISGRNSTETLALLVQGIRTQQIDVLRSAGITISAANAYKQYAQAHHIAESAITETQKQQILLDEVLKQGISIQGAYAAALETPSKQLRSIPRLLNDIELNIGQAFEPALGKVITAGYKLALVFRDATEKGQPLRAVLDRAGVSLTQMLAPLDQLVPRVKSFFGSLDTQKLDVWMDRVGKLTPLLAGVGAGIAALALRSIPVIGPFLAVLDPMVTALGALVATQPDLRALGGAVIELGGNAFRSFATFAAPAVDALIGKTGILIPVIQTATAVVREINRDVEGGAPFWTTLAGALSAAGLSAGQVSSAVAFVHNVFDTGKTIVQGTINLFQALWEKANMVASAAHEIGVTAWPQLQQAGGQLAGSFTTLQGGFGQLAGAEDQAAQAAAGMTIATDDTRNAFVRFMTSSFVIDSLAFFSVQLPAAIVLTVSWLRILADAVALTMVAIATNVRVTSDIMRGDLPAAARDAQAGVAAAQEIMKQDAANTSAAIKATNEEMDGTVERRTEDFKNRMLHLFDTTKSGTIDAHRQMKEESLQQMREMEREAVGGSIIPDMVTSVLSWFGTMNRSGSDQMFQLARNSIGHAFSLGSGVESNIRGGLQGAWRVVNGFVNAINTALGGFGVPHITLPGMAGGGIIGVGGAGNLSFAAQGAVIGSRQVGPGFITQGPVLVGEGKGREFVIPEDPSYRGNALALLKQAAVALGVVGMQAGGILSWLPNAGAMVQGPTGGFTHAAILAATGGRAWDYIAPMGSPLYAGVPGTVLPGPGGGYGTSISFNMDAGGSVILGHLMSILAGGHVNAGTLIGRTDNTGFSTGPHLHFEVRGSAMAPGPGGAGVVDLHALIRAALSPLTSAAHALANGIPEGWARGIANSIIDKVSANIAGRSEGGPIVPGRVYRVGEQGPELFASSTPGNISPTAGGDNRAGEMVDVLGSIDRRLARIEGADTVSARTAGRRF